MKKFAILVMALGVLAVAAVSYAEFKGLNVYTDKTAKDNRYSPSGWMGDTGDIKVDAGWKDNPHSGTTCIKVGYTAEQKQGAGWAGVYWQNPANNWGTQPGGINLNGARKLVFWARGEKGGEKIAEFKIGGITGEYADSDTASITDVKLTPEWKEYTIELTGKDLKSISGGFCWVANAASNPGGFTIYLDDIHYE